MSIIAIVCPGFSGGRGGVVDHTARLCRSWSATGHTVNVVEDVDTDLSGVEAMLIQYVPFLYGRRGLSRVPLRFASKCRNRNIPCAAFVHEPWVPPTRLPWKILSGLQRRQLMKLMKRCTAVTTPVPAWVRLLGHGATLTRVGATLNAGAETTGGTVNSPVLFSPFASGLRWDWILSAIEKIDATPALTVVGGTYEHAVSRGLPLPPSAEAWDWRGFTEAGDVLSILASAPIALAPYTDGLSARRTSAMATLSVGTRMVSSTGHLFDDLFGSDSPVVTCGDSDSFANAASSVFESEDTAGDRAIRKAWYDAHLNHADLDDGLLKLVIGGSSGENVGENR